MPGRKRPVSLAKSDLTFHNRKLVPFNTYNPRSSRIEAAFEESDQRRYFVPCPDCGEKHFLKWQQVRWPEGKPDEAVYVCESCGSVWDDVTRQRAIQRGEWMATGSGHYKTAGFHLSGLYSPWTPLAVAARDFLEAKKLPEQLRVWVNTFLGETWEDHEQIEDARLLTARRLGRPVA